MNKKSKFSLRLRESFFRDLLFVFAVVLVWRGLWNLMDLYIFPENPLLSNVVSVVLGVVLLYLPDRDLKGLV